MIHSSNYKPRIYPVLADLDGTEMDRVQSLDSTTTLNRTKIEEVGRDGIVDWRSTTPQVSVTMRQLEYGNIELYRQLAGKGSTVTQVNFTDYKTPKFDIVGYKTDDDGTFLGTILYPSLRVSGWNLNIGDPDALLERGFTFVGEDEIFWQNANKYYVSNRYVIATTGLDRTVTVSDPTPVADPDLSGRYLYRVVKYSGGTATQLTHGTGWSYNGAGTLTINGSSTAGDVIRVWYSGGSYQSGASTFTNNDTDVGGISADSSDIFIVTGTRVSRLQSVSVDTTFDRQDIREIGNTEVVAQGTRDITHRITLGRIIETYSIEEILRGKAGVSYGKLNVRNYLDNLSLVIKTYSDSTKATFKLGYKFMNLSPTNRDTTTPTSDYINAGNTLEGEEGFITNVNAVL